MTSYRPPPGRARGVRIATYVGALIACGIVTRGETIHAIGGVVTAMALALYLLDAPRFFRLVLMWCGGFLLIITPEGLTDAETIARIWGRDAYDVASRCLVASHLACLLGHDLVFNERAIRPLPTHWRLEPRAAFMLLGAATLLAYIYFVPLAIQTYLAGRVGADEMVAAPSSVRAVLQGVATSAGIVVPIAAVWLLKDAPTRLGRLALALMAGSITALHLATGVRFMLLFTIVGAVIAWTAPRPPSRRTLATLLAAALALAFVSSVLRTTRTFGLQSADVGAAVRGFSTADVVMSEQSVRTMAQAVVYTKRFGYTYGETSTALAVFWVPRAVWPSKPTLIGYWLPRAFDTTSYGKGFSAAPGFAGGTFLDFGLGGSVACWLVLGLAFGFLERWTARLTAAERDARILLVAPLYGGTFFAVRSIETATLVLAGVFLLAIALLVVSARRRTSLPDVPV